MVFNHDTYKINKVSVQFCSNIIRTNANLSILIKHQLCMHRVSGILFFIIISHSFDWFKKFKFNKLVHTVRITILTKFHTYIYFEYGRYI